MSVSATSTPVIVANNEADLVLKKIPCINYPLCFQKNNVDVRALIDLSSEVNAMILTFAAKQT